MKGLALCPKLEYLSVSSNALKTISLDEMPDLRHLDFLGLFGNYLESEEEVVALIRSCPQLSELIVAGNPLRNDSESNALVTRYGILASDSFRQVARLWIKPLFLP